MENYYSIGAVSWHLPRYETEAKKIAAANPKSFIVVTAHPKGEGQMAWGFDTRQEAQERYTALTMNPNTDGLAYVALFDKVNPADPNNPDDPAMSTMFGATTNSTRQSAAGWIFGGVATMLGLMVVGKKRR